MKDGGPAFPSKTLTGASTALHDIYHPGMSLRDWFAGMALSGIMISAPDDSELLDDDIAKWAYDIAEAMLAEKEQREKEES